MLSKQTKNIVSTTLNLFEYATKLSIFFKRKLQIIYFATQLDKNNDK